MSNKKCTSSEFNKKSKPVTKKVSNNCSGKVNCLVCQLVAESFVPNPNNLPYVDHIDGDYKNNHADNLYWTAILPVGPQMYVKLRK